MRRIDIWNKVRKWEIALFFAWAAALYFIADAIGGVPYGSIEVNESGMYHVSVKGVSTEQIVKPILYRTWQIASYSFILYAMFFAIKYIKYIDFRHNAFPPNKTTGENDEKE